MIKTGDRKGRQVAALFFWEMPLACSYPWRVTPQISDLPVAGNPQIPDLPVAGNPLDSGIWSAEETPGAGCIVIKECEYEGPVRRGIRVIFKPA